MVNEILAIASVPLLIGSVMMLTALGIRVYDKASQVNSNRVTIKLRD